MHVYSREYPLQEGFIGIPVKSIRSAEIHNGNGGKSGVRTILAILGGGLGFALVVGIAL